MEDKDWLYERLILAPTNETLGWMNEELISQMESDIMDNLSIDNLIDTDQVTSYPVCLLNSLELLTVPSHKMVLHGLNE